MARQPDTDSPSRRLSGERVRRHFVLSGLVQGVGFRPFVYVLASELGLTGLVANDASGVVVEVEGEHGSVAAFARRLVEDAPPMAVVEGVRTTTRPTTGGTGFTIQSPTRGEGRTLASPDIATCDDCLDELADPADRRIATPSSVARTVGHDSRSSPRFATIEQRPRWSTSRCAPRAAVSTTTRVTGPCLDRRTRPRLPRIFVGLDRVPRRVRRGCPRERPNQP